MVAPLDVAICHLIEASARDEPLPVIFLTRLIWQESSFRPSVESPAGAQGIAQFMPATAAGRGLSDPFDPAQAIPAAAGLLAGLATRFGNLGLAAAAYNAGPARGPAWLEGKGRLPAETQSYVLAITGRPAPDWRAMAPQLAAAGTPDHACLAETAAIRARNPRGLIKATIPGSWAVQLAGSFDKARALAAYARARHSYAALLDGLEPVVIGGVFRPMGFKTYYRVRAAVASRAAASTLCGNIIKLGGGCAALRE